MQQWLLLLLLAPLARALSCTNVDLVKMAPHLADEPTRTTGFIRACPMQHYGPTSFGPVVAEATVVDLVDSACALDADFDGRIVFLDFIPFERCAARVGAIDMLMSIESRNASAIVILGSVYTELFATGRRWDIADSNTLTIPMVSVDSHGVPALTNIDLGVPGGGTILCNVTADPFSEPGLPDGVVYSVIFVGIYGALNLVNMALGVATIFYLYRAFGSGLHIGYLVVGLELVCGVFRAVMHFSGPPFLNGARMTASAQAVFFSIHNPFSTLATLILAVHWRRMLMVKKPEGVELYAENGCFSCLADPHDSKAVSSIRSTLYTVFNAGKKVLQLHRTAKYVGAHAWVRVEQ